MVGGFFFFVFFVVSLWVWSGFHSGAIGWGLQVLPLSFPFQEWGQVFLLDELSGMCGVMLFCCGVPALFYCFHYLGSAGSPLFPLMVWFLSVMVCLVMTSSVGATLFFWEYLGLISFFLILFYMNPCSVRAALITLFASRFGDVSLFLFFGGLSYYCAGSWMMTVLGLLVVGTKSACFPFVSWLLEAMRAPTPVSSLVHSSTLVAAGVWFLFRYSEEFGLFLFFLLFVGSVFTVFLSAVSACVFTDLKKVVALSTCNNISWCLIYFIFGDLSLALVQLFTHGVCKCYLFMLAGDLMSMSGGSQSVVGVWSPRFSGMWMPSLLGLLVFSLCGFPFLGIFYSKHFLFVGVFGIWGFMSFLCLLVSFLMSYAYSVRFFLLLVGSSVSVSAGFGGSFVSLSVISFLGCLFNLMGSGCLLEYSSFSPSAAMLFLCLQLCGVLIGSCLFVFGGSGGFWESLVWGNESFVGYLWGVFAFSFGLAMVGLYRWETYALRLLPKIGLWVSRYGFSFLSLNYLVLGLVYSVGLSVFLL